MAKKVAEVLVDSLVASGVKRVYGIVGDSLNGIADSIRSRSPNISWLGVRHEESAAFAAGAEAHLTGKLTVCAGSCGPGNTHLINGLYDCNRSRVPVLAIAAQIPSREIGTSYFQETHPELLFRECSLYCELISHPEQMPRVLEIAMRTSISERGVSVVVLPGDVALMESTSDRRVVALERPESTVCPSEDELQRAANILNEASKVTILGGAGCEGAHSELIEVAGLLGAPIVHALRGKEFIEYDNPYDVGMTGLLGFSSGYYAMMNADALLMLGTDFPYQQFYPQNAKKIQVDIRGGQIGRRTRVDLGLVGDVGQTLRALKPHLKKNKNGNGSQEDGGDVKGVVGVGGGGRHLRTSLDHYRRTRADLDSLAIGNPGKTPIHPQFVAKVVDEMASDDAIFTCDVGTPTLWAARYLRMNGRRRLLGSFSHGSMAGALPQALGAQAAFPGRQVISLSGDGGLSMLMGDFFTLRQHGLPVKVVVFANAALDFVELEMKAAGLIEYGTDLVNPDFSKIAEADGVLGIKVEKPEELRPALSMAFEHDGPALLDVTVNRQELLIPPTIGFGELKGFALYMARAVLNGRGDEVVDLARTNLFR
jgi:pyruvate dehydrogenase (quinone)